MLVYFQEWSFNHVRVSSLFIARCRCSTPHDAGLHVIRDAGSGCLHPSISTWTANCAPGSVVCRAVRGPRLCPPPPRCAVVCFIMQTCSLLDPARRASFSSCWKIRLIHVANILLGSVRTPACVQQCPSLVDLRAPFNTDSGFASPPAHRLTHVPTGGSWRAFW